MSIGLPPVGYRNTPAVNELIHDGENGFLCDDGIDDFAAHLRTLMADPALRIRMGSAARVSMKQYAAENIWGQWETLMETIVSEQR